MQQNDVGLHVSSKETAMQPKESGLHINPSDETIRLGPLVVRFLITGENSNGSVAAFESASRRRSAWRRRRIATTITKRPFTASTAC